jgi:hypothetical protein
MKMQLLHRPMKSGGRSRLAPGANVQKQKTTGSSKTERATNPSSRNGPGRGNQQKNEVFGVGGKLKSASGRTESWSGHQTPVKKLCRRSDELTGPETDAERQRLERGQDETLPNKSPAAGDRAYD